MANGSEIQIARKQIVGLLESQKAQITMALPKHLTADRLCRVAVTEMSKNPKLFECTPTSILASIIVSAQMGWEVGVLGQAYLVPYKGICQLIPGWQGVADLVARAGRASVWTGAVRPGDVFDYSCGTSPFIEHKPGDDDAEAFTYVYAVGRIKGAEFPIIEVQSRAKVKKHLATYNKVGGMHYALQNENNLEMYGRKVALLQVMKYMPKSIEIQKAQELEYRGAEGLQNLTISSTGIQDADFVDISPDGQQQEQETSTQGGAEGLKDAIKSARQRGASPAQPAAQPAAATKPNGADHSDSDFFAN